MRLCRRVKRWVALRKQPPAEKRVAMLLYGFPPGVGAVGTAALLNVPASIERVLGALREEGYDLGDLGDDLEGVGEAIVAALRAQVRGAPPRLGTDAALRVPASYLVPRRPGRVHVVVYIPTPYPQSPARVGVI